MPTSNQLASRLFSLSAPFIEDFDLESVLFSDVLPLFASASAAAEARAASALAPSMSAMLLFDLSNSSSRPPVT